jgi:hypothetical protein
MDKKFIIVQDESMATKLLANGFQIVAQVNGTYTFMNIVPQHFNFAEIDKSKLAYTNILCL